MMQAVDNLLLNEDLLLRFEKPCQFSILQNLIFRVTSEVPSRFPVPVLFMKKLYL